MKSIFIITFIFFFFSEFCYSQDVIFKDVKHFKVDVFGNIYVVKNGNKFEKYDSLGNFNAVYSSNKIAEISSVDVSDPFNILVFVKSFGTIVFLDKTLSEKLSPIELQQLNLNDVEAACISYNNGFWIYSSSDFELIRFNNNLVVDQRSVDFSQSFGNSLFPTKINEVSNNIYLLDSSGAIFLFDRFGAYIKPVYNLNAVDFFIQDKFVFIAEKNQIFCFSSIADEIKILAKTELNIKEFCIFRNKLFILFENGDLISQYF